MDAFLETTSDQFMDSKLDSCDMTVEAKRRSSNLSGAIKQLSGTISCTIIFAANMRIDRTRK
jgi:hypothetical protein